MLSDIEYVLEKVEMATYMLTDDMEAMEKSREPLVSLVSFSSKLHTCIHSPVSGGVDRLIVSYLPFMNLRTGYDFDWYIFV